MAFTQLCLITGFYLCDNCGQLCDRLRKTRRFRLCDECYERIVPQQTPAGMMVEHGSPEQEAIERYWKWYGEMEQRIPTPYRHRHVAQRSALPTNTDEVYPYCECGKIRKQNVHAHTHRRQLSLFGGPFFDLCPTCNIKRQVENYIKAGAWLHRDWDDEEWLDLLWAAIPEAFELGVLPGYWYELRRRPDHDKNRHSRP